MPFASIFDGLKYGSATMSRSGAEVKTSRDALAMATATAASKSSVRSRGVMMGCSSGFDEAICMWPRERGTRGQKAEKRVVPPLSARSSATGTISSRVICYQGGWAAYILARTGYGTYVGAWLSGRWSR